MTTQEITTLINNLGMPIVIIGFVGWSTIKVAIWGDKLVTNHLTHINENLIGMGLKLDKLIEIAERNSPKT